MKLALLQALPVLCIFIINIPFLYHVTFCHVFAFITYIWFQPSSFPPPRPSSRIRGISNRPSTAFASTTCRSSRCPPVCRDFPGKFVGASGQQFGRECFVWRTIFLFQPDFRMPGGLSPNGAKLLSYFVMFGEAEHWSPQLFYSFPQFRNFSISPPQWFP